MSLKRKVGKQSEFKEAVLSAISHSTENSKKVKASILELLPKDIREKYAESFTLQVYKGFHGNEIKFIQIVIKGKDAMNLLKNILCNLNESSINMLLETLNERIDKSGNLYLRVGKQDAYKGRIEFLEGDDTIKIIFKPRYHRDDFWAEFISNQITVRCKD